MPTLKSSPSICRTCLRSLSHTHNVNRLFSTNPALPPSTAHAPLPTRRLISISGTDAAHFLQGLTTANVPPTASSQGGFYSAFLNASGRVLHDVFIYPTRGSSVWQRLASEAEKRDTGFLIEVDSRDVEGLARHLKRFKLRAKVGVRVVEVGEWGVWAAWGKDGVSDGLGGGDMGLNDERAPGMGVRMVMPTQQKPEGCGEEVETGSYDVRRMLMGVAEGQGEIIKESALPQESNIDYMGGVDFRKGCYVGQELTIRTHHTGVVRKRILPMQLYDGIEKSPGNLDYERNTGLLLPPRGSNVSRVDKKGRSAGKWIGGVGNVGLALCRLEIMTDTVLTGEGSQWSPHDEFKVAWDAGEGAGGEEVKIKAFVPEWHRLRAEAQKLRPNI